MDYIADLLNSLSLEKTTLENSLAQAKKTRDSAPSAMESHSDTTRSEFEKMATALEEQLDVIKNNIKLITAHPEQIVPHGKYLLVPDGLGGKKIGDMITVSVSSPLGKTLSSTN